LCGYNHPGQIYKYSKNPELSLVQFHPEYMVENYGITYLYVYNILLNYFKNNPVDFTFNLVRDPKKGLESIENIMSKFNHNIKSRELFNNFALKNVINTAETDFYYEKSLDDFLIIPLKQNDFSNSLKMDRVVSFGADYIRFVQDNSFNSVNFDFVGVKESAWAYFPDYVEYGIYAVTYFDFDKKNTLNIDRLRLDSDNKGSFTFDKFGLEYNTVDLVITNTTKNESVAYRYKASKKTVSRENSKLEKAKNMLSPYIKNTFENKNINGYNNYLKLFEKINTDIEKNQIESVLY
ncbi:MAG: hypothetical protein WC002_09945, partial [Candidatus Muiribacteriota bacterium]